MLGLVVIAVSMTGCSRDKAALPHNDPSVKAYGYGPQPNPKVRYQPDVVLIGSGPKAIRGVSDDELTWAIDANSEGADQLSVGKVMFATSRAVGRVTTLEHRGKNLVVTLGPVQFTEVVRDATIDLDTTLDSKLLADEQFAPTRLVPGLPLAGEQEAVVRPAVWHPGAGGARLMRIGDDADVNKDSVKVKVRDWEIEPYWKLKGDPGLPILAGADDASITDEYGRKTVPPELEQKARDPNVLVKKEEQRQTEFGLKVLYTPFSWGGDPGHKARLQQVRSRQSWFETRFQCAAVGSKHSYPLSPGCCRRQHKWTSHVYD